MFNKPSMSSEEFIFYIDLTSEFLKKKNLSRSIASFIKEKNTLSSVNSFGVVYFQDQEAPITVYDQKDSGPVIKAIEDNWETREKKRSYFENGLFEILSYVFRKTLEARKNYRIIIISDTPSDLSEEYHNALYDLIIKAKKFNTFIDIIRVGEEKFYSDDVKLKVIVSESHGGTFYCDDPKLFSNILISLVQSKTEFDLVHPEGEEQLKAEDKTFYERLAADLISLDSEEEELCDVCKQVLCPVCEAHSDEVHKCYNCNTKYHACCAAKYAITHNIGFNHLFRCIKCGTLLKLDEDFVSVVYEEEYAAEASESYEIEGEYEADEEISVDYYEEGYIEADIQQESLETDVEYGYEETDEEYAELHPPPEPVSTKKVRIGGFFGTEIEIPTKQSNGEIPIRMTDTVVSIPEEDTEVKETISITTLKPPRKKTIKLCRICGTTLSNTHICPNCGANVD